MDYKCVDCKYMRLDDSKSFFCELSYPVSDEQANDIFAQSGIKSRMENGMVYFNENGDSLPQNNSLPCVLLDPGGRGNWIDKSG